MSFSSWMTELRAQDSYTSPVSVASSITDTDCESDSDSEVGSASYLGVSKVMKCTSRKMAFQRTAPILIPLGPRAAYCRSSIHYTEPFVQLAEVEQFDSRQSMDGMGIDEDDLMLFGNLAYFRTQHGAKSGLEYCQRSSALHSEAVSSIEDEEIFDMEM